MNGSIRTPRHSTTTRWGGGPVSASLLRGPTNTQTSCVGKISNTCSGVDAAERCIPRATSCWIIAFRNIRCAETVRALVREGTRTSHCWTVTCCIHAATGFAIELLRTTDSSTSSRIQGCAAHRGVGLTVQRTIRRALDRCRAVARNRGDSATWVPRNSDACASGAEVWSGRRT